MKIIQLTQGHSTVVDDCAWVWAKQWKWYNKEGYAARNARIDGKRTTIRLHNLIVNPPEGMRVDHIDLNTLNNLESNLRLVTHRQNTLNSRKHNNNTSGFTGVGRAYAQ